MSDISNKISITESIRLNYENILLSIKKKLNVNNNISFIENEIDIMLNSELLKYNILPCNENKYGKIN